MATVNVNLTCDLQHPVQVQYIGGNMFSADNAGNTINVDVFNDGEPATLGGSISANVIRADGATVAVSGALSGNRAYVIFPQACYAVPGTITVIIKNTESSTVTTIAAFVANVYQSTTDTVVDPGTIIPSVSALIAQIEAAVDSIPVDYSGLLATIAADYSSSKTYPVVGMYAWQGGVLKRNIVPITTAETYTAAHWTNAVLGDDLSALKSAIDDQRQTYNILPQGKYFSQVQRGNPCTINGRTFSIMPNGEVLVTGTGTANATYFLSGTGELAGWDGFSLPAGTYRFYTKEDISSYATVGARLAGESSWTMSFSKTGNNYTFAEATPITIGFSISKNTVLPEDGLLVQIMVTKVDDDFGYIAPWASYANYVPQMVDELLELRPVQGEIDYLFNQTIVESQYDVVFISGGLNPNGWGVNNDNTRIRLKGTNMPSMKTGDRIVIDSPYEGKVVAATQPGYGSKVIEEITDEVWTTGTIDIPEEYSGKYFGMVIRKIGQPSTDISGDVSTIGNYVKLYNIETVAQNTERNVLSGLNISILGDSISALKNYIPSGNTPYYSGSNHGVTSVNQMWWKVLADSTGATLLIMNAWSGSAVTWLEDLQHSSIPPMSDDSRCLALHAYIQTDQDEEGAIEVTAENIDSIVTSPFFPAYTPAIGDYVKKIDPDIVIIAGGVNDYTYAQSAQSEALPWNGKTTPVITASFTEAYACMIKKIQQAYPSAIVVALSTWFTMRGDDNGYTLTHTVGSNVYTQTDYNDTIRAVAEQMHIPYMDVSNIGFNRNNFYPTYASDSSTIPTHPNAAGQFVMGRAVTRKIVPLVKAFKER